jgi:hypothetical protein
MLKSLIVLFTLCPLCSVSNFTGLENLISNAIHEKNNVKLYMYDNKHSVLKKLPRMYWRLELELWHLLPKEVWTTNAEEADYFVFLHTLFGHWDRKNGQQNYIRQEIQPRLLEIYHRYPYFNRSHGR